MPYKGSIWYAETGESVPTWNEGMESNALHLNSWYGKSVTYFGDSITQQSKWQPTLNNIIGFGSETNRGVGGTRIAGNDYNGMVTTDRIDSIPQSDLILFMGGTNDWGGGITLGDIYKSNILNTLLLPSENSKINTSTGVVDSNVDYWSSEFYFPVISDEDYRFEGVKVYTFYDTNKAFISGVELADESEYKIKTPVNAEYVRVSRLTNTTEPLISVSKSSNDFTVSGSASLILERLLAKFPQSTVVVMGTPYGMLPNSDLLTDKYGLKNNIGLTTTDYSLCLKKVAEYHGCPFIDISSLCGWNEYNIDTYVTYDGAYLHPNDTGGKRIGNIVAGQLLNISPRYEQ